jgi:hypothetical protein
MNHPILTNRQIALQCATEYVKKDPNLNSHDILDIAKRFNKFLVDGVTEDK